MSQVPTASIAHIGICTSNIKQSIQFYTEALGFVLDGSLEDIGPPYDTLTELPGVKCCAYYVKSGAVRIELIGYPDSAVLGPAERRPMNQLGFTHMTLMVDDIDNVTDRVVQYGGQVHPQTRINSPFGPMVFCTDPNGVRIELFQATG